MICDGLIVEYLHAVHDKKLNQITTLTERIRVLRHQIQFYASMAEHHQAKVVKDLLEDIKELNKNSSMWDDAIRILSVGQDTQADDRGR